METLEKQVRRARRRLSLQMFVRSVTWFWFGLLLLAAGAIVADWYFAWKLPPVAYVGSALGLGVLLAAVWTIAFRRGAVEAAIEMDQRFGLRERVSSALSLSPEDRETEAGQALTSDAIARVKNVDVNERFGVRLSRWSLAPVVPAAVAFLLTVFLPEMTPQPSNPQADQARAAEQVKKPAEVLKRKLAERRKQAREKNLEELEKMFAKLERATREELLKSNKPDRKDAVVKLNDLKKDLQQRKDQLGAKEKLQKQLANLKGMNDGPADKLAEALKDGDLKKAIEEIDKLRDQMEKGELDAEAQKKLAEQLDKMQQKLQEAIDAHKQKMQQLKEQIDKAKAAGDKQRAEQLQQQLDKMQAQQNQMQQLQQMQQKLGQCAQCMKQGDQQGALAGLKEMQADLQSLQQQLDELEMLDAALDEIAQAKDQMLCDQCGGMGCQACMGQGQGQDGMGMGLGQGRGPRPESDTEGNKFVDSKVPQKTGPGAGVIVGEVDGPNIKGQVRESIKAELEAGFSEDSDPLTGQRLPRGYSEYVQEYFDKLRDGK